MDLPLWFILATVLLIAVGADPTDQGPQKFSDSPSADTSVEDNNSKIERKQHKRAPRYEEVILYLTPTQIKVLESGKGLMTHQQAVALKASEQGQGFKQPQQALQYAIFEPGQGLHQPQPEGFQGGQELVQAQQKAKYPAIELVQGLLPPRQAPQSPQLTEHDLSTVREQIKEHMQNSYNEAGQKLQNEVKKHEMKQKEQMQQQEVNENKSTKDKEQQNLDFTAPQPQQFEIQNKEKYIELPLPLQFIPQDWSHLQHQYGVPSGLPHFEQKLIVPPVAQLEPHLIPVGNPSLKHLPLPHGKHGLDPHNYAFLYFYPHEKPVNNDNSQLFYPSFHEQASKGLYIHQEPQPVFNLHPNPKFQLVPYEYNYQDKLEAEKILQAQLEEQEVNAQHLEAHKLETHQLEDFDAQQQLNHKDLEPHYHPQHEKPHTEEKKIEPQELKLKIIPNTAALLAQPSKEIKVDFKKLDPIRQEEMKEIYEAQKFKAKTEAEEKEAQRLDAQLKEEELKAEKFKAEQMQEQLLKSQEFRHELFNSPEFEEERFKNHDFKDELFKLQEFKEKPYENIQFKEESFPSQPPEDEIYKNEYPDLQYLQKLEPKKSQMYSILNPLFQGHSITESLQQQKATFPHHRINLETGFKPLQYAPKFNDKKYAREVEKILKRNQIEKQKALAKAAAIANEPPMIINQEEKIIEKPMIPPMPVIKQIEIPVPTPVMVPIPTPIEVKVPQPYPVPMEIIRPFPISILKTEKVEVKKPIPIEVEKRVPIPVSKNVYVKVDKPYFVQKMIPIEVKREIPVEIPMKLKTPLKFSIIKHVWKH